MRAVLREIVRDLVARTPAGTAITIDDVGDAIGTRAVTPPEIETILALLEKSGRLVRAGASDGQDPRGEAHLKEVVAAARALRAEGLTTRADDIAVRTGLTREQVDHALALVRVMQR